MALVEMRDIWKSFPGVIANKGIDFNLKVGEIHALLGENGAGKSTLMKILSGLYRSDAGTIFINGNPMGFRSPTQALSAGIGMVHQHFRLVKKFTVAQNIHLGWEQTPKQILHDKLTKRTAKICEEFGLAVDPHAKIWQLSTGERQRVEILRVLARGARVLILDEPTAVLTPDEVKDLFRVMRSLAENGRALVFISHKLNEVLDVSDRVTVLRKGRNVTTRRTSGCDQKILARLMVGEDIIFQEHERKKVEGDVVLELRNGHAFSDRGLPALVNVNLTIKSGEILGVAGVAGNGQKELAEVLTGLRSLQHGTVLFDNVDITGQSPYKFATAGIGHVPEDRTGTGLVLSTSVTKNAILREYRDPPISSGFLLDNSAAALLAQSIVDQANVQVQSLNASVGSLSGGNQQRLLTQREIRTGSHLLVAVHPTRGLDVAATEAVRKRLIEHRNRGVAVLLISEDLDEILAMSDRIVVMSDGQIVGNFDAESAIREEIGLLMGGV